MITFIFDLDGTIADVRHRLHHILCECGRPKHKPDWHNFFMACDKDSIIQGTAGLFRRLAMFDELAYGASSSVIEDGDGPSRVWIWTGRGDQAKAKTQIWLDRHEIYYDDLKMRPEGCKKQDKELKLGWIKEAFPHMGQRPNVVMFDDRQEMVDFYMSQGIYTVKVPGHDELQDLWVE